MIERLASRELRTKFGKFTEILYRTRSKDVIALVLGDVAGRQEVLCRIHCACLGGHVFNSTECECAEEMASAQQAISEAGRGVIIYLDQEGKGNGHLALMLSTPHKAAGMSQEDAYVAAGFDADARDYQAAAEVLDDLEVSSILLLTNNPKKASDMKAIGVKVSGTR